VRVTFDFDPERAVAAVAYLAAQQIPDLTKWRICKLLYLADRVHLAHYGRPITGDAYYALRWGPIPSQTLDALDDENELAMDLADVLEKSASGRYPTYSAKSGADARWKDALSVSDTRVLNETVERYRRMSFDELGRTVHDTPAFKKAWEAREPGEERALMSFEDFFEGVAGAHPEILDELRENLGARPTAA
jgi:uncharacterized phage-associated protein